MHATGLWVNLRWKFEPVNQFSIRTLGDIRFIGIGIAD